MKKKTVLWVKEASINSYIKRAFFKFLCVNTCSTVSHDPFLLQHLKIHILLILKATFNFVSNYTIGCFSWQCNGKENFVNGHQMPKWRLFVDWWAERQRGKNPKQAKAKIISKAPGGFSLCQTWSFPSWVDPSLFQPPLKLNKSCILLMALRCNEFWWLKVWNANVEG